MDIETVRELIQLMVDNDLAELEVQDGEKRVRLKCRGEEVTTEEVAALAAEVAAQHAPQTQSTEPAPPAEPPVAEAAEDPDRVITSPMVGTFYASGDPETPPYVQAGSEIQPDSIVCIIEAMKVYNEIKAETTGVVEKVLVRNEEPVEFGQPLFVIRPVS